MYAGSQMEESAHPDLETLPRSGRLLRLPAVIERVGLKRSAIYQRMSEGRFPRSRSLGPKCVVWVEAEIDDWVRTVIGGNGG